MVPDAPPPPPALPDLTPEEADLVAAYPLPPGVEDALLSKALLAIALDTSQTSVDAWRMAGMPVHAEGRSGRAYQFRLSVCHAWRRDREEADLRSRRAAEDTARQMRLAILGPEAGGSGREGLTPRQVREALEIEYQWMMAARARRDLIPAAQVAEAFEAAFCAIRDGLDAAPDRLAREIGLDGRGVEAAQAILDDVIREARRRVEEMIGD